MYFKLENVEHKSEAELLEIFKKIPKHCLGVDLTDNNLGSRSNAVLIAALKMLAQRRVKLLVLSQNNWEQKKAEELAELLAAIPANITSVDFSMTILKNYSADQLEMIFAAIPPHVTDLSLDETLQNIPPAALIQCFKKLSYVRKLSLMGNKLELHSVAELANILDAISDRTGFLNIAANKFWKKSQEDWAAIMAAIKPTVFSVNTGMLPLDLEFACQSFPQGIRSLHLDNNDLRLKTGEVLAAAFKKLPKYVEELSLIRTHLGDTAADTLATGFKELPPSIKKLILNNNKFWNKSAKELADMLRSLPETITVLELAENGLGNKANEELTEIFKAISKGVHFLNLGDNNLFTNLDGLPAVFAAIPDWIRGLNLSGNAFTSQTVVEIAAALKGLHKDLVAINLSEVEFDKLSLADLEQLKDSLPQVRIVHLNYAEMFKMSADARKALLAIFPNVQDVFFVDNKGDEVGYNVFDKANLARIFGFTASIPSLRNHATFFLRRNPQIDISEAPIPYELKTLVNPVKFPASFS